MKVLSKVKKEVWGAILICLIFFTAYFILSLTKHNHFLTGYDLGVVNQYVYEYSHFTLPISTVNNYAFSSVFSDHIEFIYLFLSPFYWILPDAGVLIFFQALFIAISGIPVFFLARRHKINITLSLALLISYFTFYGIQNALWADVHSIVFASSFLAFFIWFLDNNKKWPAILFFLLAITCKEDVGLLTALISFVFLIKTKKRINLFFILASISYLFFVFFVYYPFFTSGYFYAGKNGLLADINILNIANTVSKQQVIFYSLASFGFLPLLVPFFLVPFLGDLSHYFIIANSLTSAQNIFLHYRVSLSILLIFPVVFAIERFKKLNTKYFALYILFFPVLITYVLHAPLTYLAKQWFWQEPQGVKNINQILRYLPKDASVVSQNNITPHISNRNLIFTLFADTKDFKTDSPCEKTNCQWFKWAGDPHYLIVDVSNEWNILQLLSQRENFVSALSNMEKTGNIRIYKQIGTSTIYSVLKKPF